MRARSFRSYDSHSATRAASRSYRYVRRDYLPLKYRNIEIDHEVGIGEGQSDVYLRTINTTNVTLAIILSGKSMCISCAMCYGNIST